MDGWRDVCVACVSMYSLQHLVSFPFKSVCMHVLLPIANLHKGQFTQPGPTKDQELSPFMQQHFVEDPHLQNFACKSRLPLQLSHTPKIHSHTCTALRFVPDPSKLQAPRRPGSGVSVSTVMGRQGPEVHKLSTNTTFDTKK